MINKISSTRLESYKNSMIIRFYLFSALRTALFHIPILVIYFMNVLGSSLQIGILISLKTISSLIFEIPTGIIADRVSRKLSVIIGLLLNACSLIIFVIQRDFIWFGIAQVMFGIAETFYSGADSALLYDNLKDMDSEELYEKLCRNLSLFGSIALFISFITGSYFYSMSKTIPFILSAAAIGVALVIFISIFEHPYKKEKSDKINLLPKALYKQPMSIWSFIVFSNIIGSIFYATYLFFIPILLKESGIVEKNFGIIMSIGVITYGIGSKYSTVIKKREQFIKIGVSLIATITFIIAAIFKSSLSVVCLLIVMRLLWGAYTVIYDIELNSRILDSSVRASMISIGSAIEGGVTSIITILFGFLISYLNTSYLLALIGGMFIIASVGFLLAMKRFPSNYNKNFKEEQICVKN